MHHAGVELFRFGLRNRAGCRQCDAADEDTKSVVHFGRATLCGAVKSEPIILPARQSLALPTRALKRETEERARVGSDSIQQMKSCRVARYRELLVRWKFSAARESRVDGLAGRLGEDR